MAILSLSQFRKEVSDFARPNRFSVIVTPPTSYDFKENEFMKLPWLAETATIPARTQGEITMKFHGMEYKLTGDYAKENLTIGFLNSYGWEGRNFFEMWMENIQTTSEVNDRLSSYDVTNDSMITVNQLGRTEADLLASYEFYNVFPTNISAIELNMGEYDSIEKFTVGFTYSHFSAMEVGV
jgi:hypothetical protein